MYAIIKGCRILIIISCNNRVRIPCDFAAAIDGNSNVTRLTPSRTPRVSDYPVF
jgi:hypothetical protein